MHPESISLGAIFGAISRVGQGIYCSKWEKTHHTLRGGAESVGQHLCFLQDHHFEFSSDLLIFLLQ